MTSDNDTISLQELEGKFDKSKGFLKICHVNVENLIVHRDNFINAFGSSKFDVITISETFLKPVIPSTPYLMQEFHLIRHDREGKEGGGLAVFVRKCFTFKIIAKSDSVYCRKPEFLILELSMSLSWKLLVCLVYRPPKIGHINEVFDIIENMLPVYNNIVLIGDLNTDLYTDRAFADKTQLLELVNRLNLHVLPMRPTYHRPNSDSWLDLIILNDLVRVKQFGQTAISGLSYHDMIFVELNLKTRIFVDKRTVTIRDFKNLKVEALLTECKSLNWTDVNLSDDIDNKVQILEDNINVLFNKHVPMRVISKKRNPCPWLNDEIRSLMKQRDQLYRRYVRTKDRAFWEDYRTHRNRVKRIIRDARNSHLSNFLNEKPSKDIWNCLRENGSGKEPKSLSDPKVDLNNLNDFFCGVQNNVNMDLINYYRLQRNNNYNSFQFQVVDCDFVSKCMTEISSNAIGNDNVSLRFLKILFDEIKPVVCHILNFSLSNSVYPSQWKKALVIPLPKVKEPCENKHFRPINILCVLGKILDKIVYKQVRDFLNSNNILSKYQSGYRSLYSTQTALIKITDDIRKAIDERKLTVLLLLDFTRAFDSVNHKLLVSVLESYNFGIESVKWFQSYLEGRYQRIKTCSGNLSDWKLNPVGVPQGSTLSAMLFSIYINRICNDVMFCKTMLYADDIQLYIHSNLSNINDAIRMLNSDLETLYVWCRDHGLSLNISKCKPIVIGNNRIVSNLDFDNISPVVIHGEDLEYQNSVVNLGLRFDNFLSWNQQVNHICSKVYQSIYQFRRLTFKPTLEIRKLLVVTMIFPFFDYANAAFCDLNITLTSKLQKAQNSCIRYIFNLNYDEHVTPFYRQLGWLKIRERIDYSVLSSMYKVLKNKKPDYLYERYVTLYHVHLRQTRFGSTTLQFPIHRTVTYSNSFHVRSIRLMNNLDSDIKDLRSEKMFLKRIKSKLLSVYDD